MNVSRWIPFRRPSPALVISCIALLVALSGTGYAAVALPRNSVGTIQLKAGAVTSPKVRDGSLAAADLSPAARKALTGQIGPQGPAGPKGDRGDSGPAGTSGWQMVSATTGYDSNSPKTVVVTCPEGKRLLGGSGGAWGRAMVRLPVGVVLTASHSASDRAWVAAAHELVATEDEWYLQVTAICATVN